MLKKRIIPCLDVKDGRVVKGVNFVNLADVGDPVDAARAYYEAGCDELVFLDITATICRRCLKLGRIRWLSIPQPLPILNLSRLVQRNLAVNVWSQLSMPARFLTELGTFMWQVVARTQELTC